MAVDFSSLPLPVIRTKDGSFSYQMTGDDLLTLARSLRKEEKAGTNRESVGRLAWCYAQRLVLYPTMAPFKRMVTNHSQPINPAWFPDGTYCKPGGEYHGEQPCASAASRPANAAYAWDRMDPRTQQYIFDWASGAIPNSIPRGTDFAAADLVARKIAGGRPWNVVYQGIPGSTNTIVDEPGSRAWSSADWVQLQVNGKVVGADADYRIKSLVGPVAVIGAIAGAWAAWRGRR